MLPTPLRYTAFKSKWRAWCPPWEGRKPNTSVQQKSCRENQIFFVYMHSTLLSWASPSAWWWVTTSTFKSSGHKAADPYIPDCWETRWQNYRWRRPGACWRRGTYWRLSAPSTWALGLHPYEPAHSFSESITKHCLPSCPSCFHHSHIRRNTTPYATTQKIQYSLCRWANVWDLGRAKF